MPSTGEKLEVRDPETGRYLPGNRSGGRKKKPTWLNGKGLEALQAVYEIMIDRHTKPEIVLQAAKLLIEYDLGKPRQTIITDFGEESIDALAGMSLAARGAAMASAVAAYLECTG